MPASVPARPALSTPSATVRELPPPAAPVAPVTVPIAPKTPPPPQHRRPRQSAPQAFQGAKSDESSIELTGNYNEERLAEIDSMVTNARTALRDTIIMGIGFVVLVVLLVLVVF